MPIPPATKNLTDELRNAIPPKIKQFNVMLSATEYTRLQELATITNTTKARVIRAALDNAYFMKVKMIPTCASGMACPIPGVHTQTAPPPAPGQLNMTEEPPPEAA